MIYNYVEFHHKEGVFRYGRGVELSFYNFVEFHHKKASLDLVEELSRLSLLSSSATASS